MQIMNPDLPSPASDSKNATTSVADAALADPVILPESLAAPKDQYLRLAADFDNFKKRTRRGYCRNDKVFRPAKVIVNDLRHSPGAGHAR